MPYDKSTSRQAKKFWKHYSNPNQITRTTAEYLKYLPDSMKTRMICDKAVAEYPGSIRYIAPELKTEEYYKEMIWKGIDIFSYLAAVEKTPALCLTAVTLNSKYFTDIPYKRLTDQICEIAVKKDPEQIKNVPFEFMTQELIMLAIEKKPELLFYLPKSYHSKELYLEALKRNGFLIQEIADIDLDTELVETAIQDIADRLGIPDAVSTSENISRKFFFSKDKIWDFLRNNYQPGSEDYTVFFHSCFCLYKYGFISEELMDEIRAIDNSCFKEKQRQEWYVPWKADD